MQPVCSPAAMAAVDAAVAESVDVLIERAGWAVARAAIEMLGGTYGRRVIVIAGKGNNGNDGRVATRLLERRGVRVEMRGPEDRRPLVGADLVIDAAYGTGFRGTYEAPAIDDTPVLAVDLPSGIDATTGRALGTPLRATRTVTFAALKPGLLFADGVECAGDIEVADIGLDVAVGREFDGAPLDLLEPGDLTGFVRPRRRSAHKWNAATWVIGGSPGMAGAGVLSAIGAQAAGASYVRASSLGVIAESLPVEAVSVPLPLGGWAQRVLGDVDRFGSLVLGPGIGRAGETIESVGQVISASSVPTVLDADALWAVAALGLRTLGHGVVVTPHDQEFEYLSGSRPGPDRVASARSLARSLNCVVLLKGPTTVVAAPDGRARLSTAGDARLATAGTGDVLSGVIGALMASGMAPFDAAACGALVHGLGSLDTRVVGTRARDLAEPISALLSNAVLTQMTSPDRMTR